MTFSSHRSILKRTMLHITLFYISFSFFTLIKGQSWVPPEYLTVRLPSLQQHQRCSHKLIKGDSLLSAFNFETYSPTHGVANYLSQEAATSSNLISVDPSTKAVTLKVSTKQTQLPRGSVRISSKKFYNGGLFVFDVGHVPTGCGTWPVSFFPSPSVRGLWRLMVG